MRNWKSNPEDDKLRDLTHCLHKPECIVTTNPDRSVLAHWGRVTHICVGKLSILGSNNGLSPGRRQAIIWTKDKILSIGPLGTNFSKILIEIQTFSLKKIRLKMSSAKCCSFRLGLNVLITIIRWHFQFHLVNVSILHSKYEHGAGSGGRFLCYSHCYVKWCPLPTGIVASQCLSARDAALLTRYLTPSISACLKPLK